MKKWVCKVCKSTEFEGEKQGVFKAKISYVGKDKNYFLDSKSVVDMETKKVKVWCKKCKCESDDIEDIATLTEMSILGG